MPRRRGAHVAVATMRSAGPVHFGPNGSLGRGSGPPRLDRDAGNRTPAPWETVTITADISPMPPVVLEPKDVIRNFRDVGGRPTRAGARVRTGLLYRSTDLARSGHGAEDTLAALGIRTVFDLRTAGERELWPETTRLPPDASYVVADVLRDAQDGPEGQPARMIGLLTDPERAHQLLADGRAERMFCARYRDFVNLTSARQAYHRVLSDLAVPANLPAIVHCTTGKDRSGWLIAVLLLLLGVHQDDVMADYLASNDELVPFRREMDERFAAVGGDPALLEPLMTARPVYLEAALHEMGRGFGSIDGYIDGGLAIGPLTRRRLTSIFLEQA